MATVEDVRQAVENGKAKEIAAITQEAIDGGEDPDAILDAMVEAMDTVGQKFSAGEIFVPEMLIAAKVMKLGVDVLKPHLGGDDTSNKGTFIIGTVAGDLHDIGKNLVAMMIESAGFRVVDLGIDVPTEKFLEAAKEEENVKIVGFSALLTTTLPALEESVKAVNEIKDDLGIKVMVGGAPVTQEFADEIGADGFSEDAGGAVAKANELIA